MTEGQIDAMIHALLEGIDHDIAKDYRHETAEEPDFVDGAMQDLRNIVWGHLEDAK